MSDSADKLNFDQIVHGDDYAPFALVVLNQPIQSPLFPTISRRASFSICADGGFNRLLEYAAKSRIPFEDILPQLIVGDLDSISKDALQLAQRMGVVVVRDVCQDTTDFQKALKALAKYSRGELARTPTVLAFGALDGRFDHTAASISVLYQYQHEGRLWLISNHSVVTLLHKGESIIEGLGGGVVAKAACGVIPFNGPCRVTSAGLKYEMESMVLEMGKIVSTSNQATGSSVTIWSDAPIVWTMEIQAAR